MKTTSVRHAALVAMTLFVACAGALAAPKTLHVIFVEGGALEVEACRIESKQAILTLPGGGTLAVPASRIARVEDEPSKRTDSAAPAGVIPGETVADEAAPAAAPEAASARTVDAIIREAAAKYGLEPQLLAAVIAVESGYRSDAVSPKGAQGLMQLMPATARELEVEDPFDPEQNIDGGARYLKQLLERHGDSFVEALAAYNAGAGRVDRYNGIPPYKETIEYIRRVLDQYESRLRP